jgi:hypothetical protein
MKHLYDNYFIKPANSIIHDPFRLHLLESNIVTDVISMKKKVDVQDEFPEVYTQWIKSSKLNNLLGLESFPYRHVSLGVTQAIDDFLLYCLKEKLRLRIYKGEYPYINQIVNEDLIFIEDEALKSGDAVLISAPFSATGEIHPLWCETIKTCNELSIPIFVDCAFFGTCYDLTISLDEPCIDSVAFSPTKGLNTGYFRTGLVYTKRSGKKTIFDTLTNWHHGIHMHTVMALEIMKEYGPDTVPNIYRSVQEQICSHYGLTPSKTVHLALGGEGWEYFTRDGVCNRIGLRIPIAEYYAGKDLRK